MGFRKPRLGIITLIIGALLALAPYQFAYAVCAAGIQSCSSNYSTDQSFFGSGGELNACSSGPAGYCSKQTAGELGIGKTCGTAYCAYAGFNTTDVPFLEFVVTGSNIDLGYLDTGTTSTANGVFTIRAWQSGGYVVRTESDPPTNASGGHQLAPLASQTAPAIGTEQFGINLVANTVPIAFGLGPQQVPNSSFSFGTVAAAYGTTNVYKYVKSDVIAQSLSSTSITSYTISYVFNISTATPAGKYNFAHNLVATATY